jgi:uncharacterized glyoxalase superfamily protein PhnB
MPRTLQLFLNHFYHEVLQRGIVQPKPPDKMPWGRREMHLVDPDGNRLRFAAPLHAPNG